MHRTKVPRESQPFSIPTSFTSQAVESETNCAIIMLRRLILARLMTQDSLLMLGCLFVLERASDSELHFKA